MNKPLICSLCLRPMGTGLGFNYATWQPRQGFHYATWQPRSPVKR